MKQALGAISVLLLCLATFCLGVAFAPGLSVQVQEAQARQAFSDDALFHDNQDRITQEQIKVYTDRVELQVEGLKFAPIAPTASMLPLLHSGTHTLESQPSSPDELSVGDIISFYVPDQDTYIVHAITEIGEDLQGWYAYTKGHNNPTEDPWAVRFNQIEGVLVGILY